MPKTYKTLILLIGFLLTCSRMERNNPFDPESDTWAPPSVTLMADTSVSIRDTFIVRAIASGGNSELSFFTWSGPNAFRDTTITGSIRLCFSDSGRRAIRVRAVNQKRFWSKIDSVVIQVLINPPILQHIPDTTISIRDSLYISSIANDSNGTVQKYLWAVNNDTQTDTTDSNSHLFVFMESGINKLIVKAIDDDGAISTADTTIVNVLQDCPVVNAGNDTTVTIRDTVFLKGTTRDSYGNITETQWIIGNTKLIFKNKIDTFFIAPSNSQMIPCTLKVTDDDGNNSIAIKNVRIIQDIPLVTASPDTAVNRRASINLRCENTRDTLCKILKYEWDFGNSGKFISVSDGDTIIKSPDTLALNGYLCILRVMNDDSVFGFDTVKITVGGIHSFPVTQSFTDRRSFGIAEFNNDLWILGGVDYSYRVSDNINDVWSTEDGFTWSQVAAHANYTGRCRQASIEFNNKLWQIADADWTVDYGDADIWSSGDGLTWKLETTSPGFTVRGYHTCNVYKDKLWVIAGAGYSSTEDSKDIWNTSDGITWNLVNANPPFGYREMHSSIVFQDKLWLIGGETHGGWVNDSVLDNGLRNDVWCSSDGVNWELVTNHAAFTPRSGHCSVVFENKIWVIGGLDAADYCNDIWTSVDGKNWTKSNVSGSFPARHLHQCAAFKGKLFIIGGYPQATDIWYID
jgi:hypothetical protein